MIIMSYQFGPQLAGLLPFSLVVQLNLQENLQSDQQMMPYIRAIYP